ncbi:MAG: hypothetical protein IPL01_08740 [Acidobacteria bacterium]|nr:hypothetical protein [Acidobacteriota bacterium]
MAAASAPAISTRVLQSVLNPPSERKPELTRGSHVLRSGDKVIQRVNNYKLEVFNGDVGTIEAIDLEDQMVAVRFADRIVAYDYADILELGHGFCVTVHKARKRIPGSRPLLAHAALPHAPAATCSTPH